jgi:hypothetical protein
MKPVPHLRSNLILYSRLNLGPPDGPFTKGSPTKYLPYVLHSPHLIALILPRSTIRSAFWLPYKRSSEFQSPKPTPVADFRATSVLNYLCLFFPRLISTPGSPSSIAGRCPAHLSQPYLTIFTSRSSPSISWNSYMSFEWKFSLLGPQVAIKTNFSKTFGLIIVLIFAD